MLRWLRLNVGWRPLLLLCRAVAPDLGCGNRAVRPRAEAAAVVELLTERGVALSQGPVAARSASRGRSALRPTPWPGCG